MAIDSSALVRNISAAATSIECFDKNARNQSDVERDPSTLLTPYVRPED